jgi:hypothetical protein
MRSRARSAISPARWVSGVAAAGSEEERIDARTLIWAAGVTASELSRRLAELTGAELDRAGRIAVEPDLTLPGHPEVLALGDMVRIRDARREPQVLPGVAPVAMQQGRYAAALVRARLRDRPGRPFRYRDKGNLATIGRARAVATSTCSALAASRRGSRGSSSTSGTSSASRTACSCSSTGRSASLPAAAARLIAADPAPAEARREAKCACRARSGS